jgi:predicted nucleic acid-binding protein
MTPPVKYMLDTNTVSYIIKGNSLAARQKQRSDTGWQSDQ